MSDMRDYTPANTVHAETVLVDSDDVIIKDRYTLEESGEGLGQFHRNLDDMEGDNGRAKVLGALVIALMVGAAGAYVYTMMPQQQEQVVANADLPRPMGPGGTSAMTPPMSDMAPAAETGDAIAPLTGDMNAPEPVTTPAPMERQSATPAPMRTAQAPVTPAPVDPTPLTASPTPVPSPAVAPPVAPVMPQNQAASTIPEPVSPVPPASAIAGNPPLNEQSADAVDPSPVVAPPAPVTDQPQADAVDPSPVVAPPAQPIQ